MCFFGFFGLFYFYFFSFLLFFFLPVNSSVGCRVIEPKDLELGGMGERRFGWKNLGVKGAEEGWFVSLLYLFYFILFLFCGSRRVLVLVLVLPLALVRCDAKLRGDPSRRTERQVEQIN